jgi:hypothetical protein
MRIAAPMAGTGMLPAPTVQPAPSVARPATGPSDHELQLIDRMSSTNTLRHVEVLNRAPRVWKSPAYDQAVEYVVQQLRDAGWDVRVEELQSSGGFGGSGKLRNVVAERKGTAPDADRRLVVAGAHLDSVRGAPGANDNASGSATLIELARSFSGSTRATTSDWSGSTARRPDCSARART